MTLPPLHPDHLADLRKSGLRDETIAKAGLYSACPADLGRLTGRDLPEGSSALVFPYSRDFVRVKVFPSLQGADGREVEYLQRPGSPVRAYFRGLDLARLNSEVEPGDAAFVAIRDLGYRLALTKWREVVAATATLDVPDWLRARERELWRPLLTIATLADREAGLGLVDALLPFAKAQGEERAGLSDEAEAVVAVLDERLNGQPELTVMPGDLVDALQKRLKWDRPPTPRAIGRWLQRLGFPRAGRVAGGKRRLVTRQALDELDVRYGAGGGK